MRYLIDGSVKISHESSYDVAIIGAGIAGLYAALTISPEYSCCIFAKETIDISNSWFAQGGIAAATSPDDDPELHFKDTIVAGAGICDEKAVHVLVDEGPSDIRRLISMKVPFDINECGDFDRTREGGHHKNRILHAGGDATGRETVKTLAFIASQRENITFCENTFFADIITDDENRVTGAVLRRSDGSYELVSARCIIIATGGCGQVYLRTTNPTVATGDGLAAAKRAGATLKNMEFIQFHPTGLWTPYTEDRSFLISESVRGEGGLLKNQDGVRFMLGAHELNELAPRDIVARAIFNELRKSGRDHVFVDITSKTEEELKHRFPTIYSVCLEHGVNISKDYIPVSPVQHYLMGGIETDLDAESGITGLYACGEAACTGVHGANRLASNSMLECLVFGRRAALDINRYLSSGVTAVKAALPELPVRKHTMFDYVSLKQNIKQIMNTHCFVVRNEKGLSLAKEQIGKIYSELSDAFDDSREYAEALNLTSVCLTILDSALARKKSVGAHYRDD